MNEPTQTISPPTPLVFIRRTGQTFFFTSFLYRNDAFDLVRRLVAETAGRVGQGPFQAANDGEEARGFNDNLEGGGPPGDAAADRTGGPGESNNDRDDGEMNEVDAAGNAMLVHGLAAFTYPRSATDLCAEQRPDCLQVINGTNNTSSGHPPDCSTARIHHVNGIRVHLHILSILPAPTHPLTHPLTHSLTHSLTRRAEERLDLAVSDVFACLYADGRPFESEMLAHSGRFDVSVGSWSPVAGVGARRVVSFISPIAGQAIGPSQTVCTEEQIFQCAPDAR